MKTYCSLLAAILTNLFTLAYGEDVYKSLGPETKDVWFSSYYNRTQGVNDAKLQTGGWGDSYRFMIQPTLSDLPKKASVAVLWFYCFDQSNSTSTVDMNCWRITSSWNEYTGWDTMPSGVYLGSLGAPTGNRWYGILITDLYNAWQRGDYYNYGLMFGPRSVNNQFNHFYSTDYSNPAYRPYLHVRYTPTEIQFKMPLPGGKSWLLTTEVGGYDCATTWVDPAHTKSNYYSLDFASRTVESGGAQIPDVPVLASAKGLVLSATRSDANGYYVVIDHDADGNVNTGFSTRYLHLKNQPYVSVGQKVEAGKILGIMGNTGQSQGTHLHFGIRFNNDGNEVVPELQKLKLDSRLLSDYITDCSNGIRNNNSYYYSTNQQK